MSRAVPHPVLSAALVLMWLVLTSFSLGNLLLGTMIALVAGWAVEHLHPPRPKFRRWLAIPVLMLIVARDILRSNLAVARVLVLGPDHPAYHSGFVELHLQLRDPNAIAVMAIILTATPGTAWIEFEQEDGRLLLHVLDLRSEDDWQSLIRDRYEALLMEIFE
ncbi:multisubunit potassium/proton antiporter, PhaE subunit (TC 2.A.63.1.1) [Paracoccus aminovorans]|uniref:Multisubunit potassium/proton antiporter, PhaE subunit (TC 2.A.63.1.1) n=1 Tax=Paracoccus aminovorans TaxID=34004 RepID=A0A1I2ZC64_9RHOB|nr:Na+/H+ antiporter subunit E [Paracoccus aminovorans]CQR86326.1 multicomponent K+:H+ antiporter, subunit E [Paracoccus aminovorans]SFH35354.1 multisubunit potassium/proton antiporter, PhaE subunit (TC 2.A.63.1.1) [Paracoccus aminovorans]